VNQVIAEIGLDHVADLIDVKIKHRLIEFRHHHAAAESAEIAALARRRTVGMFHRQRGEIAAGIHLFLELQDLGMGVVFGELRAGATGFVVADEDV